MTDIPSANEPAAQPAKMISPKAYPAMTPEQRLEQSRQRLRGIFQHRNACNAEQTTADNRSETTSNGNAGVELANALLKQWWKQHPWRSALHDAGEVTQKIAGETARRHPLRLIFGAAIAGAVVARVKPWRTISRGTVVRGLLLGTGAGVKAGGLLNARAVLHSAIDVLANNIRRARHRPSTTEELTPP